MKQHISLYDFPRLISIFQSLSRQTSLVEDRIDDSDEDEFQEERSGT